MGEGTCDEDFPLQKKRHSFEYMREIPHLRPRANTFYAMEKCLEQQQSIIQNLIKISLEKKLILQLQDNYMLKLLL